MNQIHEIIITPGPAYLGVTGSHSITFTMSYLEGSHPGWYASLFVHEGQHILDRGKFNDEDLWKSEQNALRKQATAGQKLGLSQKDVNYLFERSSDAHKADMQSHMKKGYREKGVNGCDEKRVVLSYLYFC
jgi:hypothetical protein